MSLTPWSRLLSCLLHFGSPHLAPFHGALFFVSQGMPSLSRLHSSRPLGAGRKPRVWVIQLAWDQRDGLTNRWCPHWPHHELRAPRPENHCAENHPLLKLFSTQLLLAASVRENGAVGCG